MARQYLKVFHDWDESTSALTHEEKGRLIDALVAYSKGKPYTISGNERFVFPAFRLQIDRDVIAYDEISEKRKAAGAKGGKQKQANEANASNCKQTPSKSSHDQDHDQDHDHDHDQDIESSASAPNRKRFTPPSFDELNAYIVEKGYAINPQHFMDHYESVGWKVGRNPMKDWRAAVRSWASRESTQGEAKRKQTSKTRWI